MNKDVFRVGDIVVYIRPSHWTGGKLTLGFHYRVTGLTSSIFRTGNFLYFDGHAGGYHQESFDHAGEPYMSEVDIFTETPEIAEIRAKYIERTEL